jgi:hypothetical protein
MAGFNEGQTATNPETGQRIVFQGGSWKPVGGAGVMSDTKTDQEALSKLRDEAKQAEFVAGQADQFVRMNTQSGTGGLRAIPGVSSIVKAFDPNFAAMDAITARVAPTMRPPGSGASSDKDVKMFRSAFPNVDALGPANVQSRDRYRSEAAQKRAYADFADQFFARNGTMLGVDKAWQARQGRGTAPAGQQIVKPTTRKPVTVNVNGVAVQVRQK